MSFLINMIRRIRGFNKFLLGWFRDAWRMHKHVADFEIKCSQKQDAIHIAIVVMPWVGSSVPWFSLVCGLFLASKGNKVSFIIDDMPFGKASLGFRLQIIFIRLVLRQLRGRHDIITLSDRLSSVSLSQSDLQSIDRLAKLNAVWSLRGEMVDVGRLKHVERSTHQLSSSYATIASVFEGCQFDLLLVPGGVWGTSGIWIEHAHVAGVRIASYDSGGFNCLLLAVNGIACQLRDIPRAFSLLKATAISDEQRAFVMKSALDEISRRRLGIDKFSSQLQGLQKADTRFSGAVLIALNSSWDSAALGMHTVFRSNTEWIVETTKYLLENTAAQVIVRQHPVERLEIASTSEDYRSLLASHFGINSRLHFIAADELINSYDLIEQVVAVIAHTSTIGTEAAAHGKIVVTASGSYYSDMGFVWKATNLAQYYQYLSDAVSERFVVSTAMREDALFCYYLTQCCNWVTTPFTVPGFVEWSRNDLQQLLQDESVQLILHALEQNIPIAYLNHLARIEGNGR